jgi:signal transduction histidine kinase
MDAGAGASPYGGRREGTVNDPGGGLRSISVVLSVALHSLLVALCIVVIATSVDDGLPRSGFEILLVLVLLATYAAGLLRSGRLWLVLLVLEWLALLCLGEQAVYLAFPLFFLCLHVLPGARGTVAVVAVTVAAVVGFGAHVGFTLAAAFGPVLGAAVALVIGHGYRALVAEVRERGRLIEELTAARVHLAAVERSAGVLEERTRLAGEIHDTVSQSLSSVIMLLHAAERADPAAVGLRLRQAQEAASEALAETRQFIHALQPPTLRRGGIEEALGRLVEQTRQASGLTVTFAVSGSLTAALPTPVETALLRVAQSSLANVVQHAGASRADVTLTRLEDEVILDVVDDGSGFDVDAVLGAGVEASYGLRGMRERVTALGGELVVESTPGSGTSVVACFEVAS